MGSTADGTLIPKPKHTPGPWRAEDHGEVQGHRGRMVTIRDHRNIHVATVDGLDATVRGQELTNAHLIAAAPELLKALERLKCWDCEYPLTQPDYAGCFSCEQARNAIKAAKGD